MILDALARLIFPPKCILCRDVLEKNETDLCRRCRVEGPTYGRGKRKIPFTEGNVAVWAYEDQVRGSVLRYKFYGARHYAAGYGRLLAMQIMREYPEGFDLLTWVPISKIRKLRRGYDQVELLAKAVGKELGMEPVALLKKIRHNKPQSGIKGEAHRRANVLGAYRVQQAEKLRGKKILLLDDVITTGATAGECARVLLTAGAEEVYCGAVAAARQNRKSSR